MAAARGRGLGKGLDTLIPEAKSESKGKKEEELKVPDRFLKITELEPNLKQPRHNFNEDKLLELADSIKLLGVLIPLLVVQNKETGRYTIVCGERRWRASKIAGLKEVPVVIKELSDQKIMEISLIENIQREDLNPIEEALAYKVLLEEFNLKQDEVAERVSKSRTAVTNSMRLLKLSEKVQQMLISEMISSGHARALLAIEDPELQHTVAMRVFDEKLSVRDIEKIIKDINKPLKQKKAKEELDFLYRDLEEKMKISLGTKVSISSKGDGKGKIEMEYYSNDELDRLVDLLIAAGN